MGLLRFVLLLVLVSCGTHPPASDVTPDSLLSKMKLSGEGKARLEIGEESWVFSFDAGFKDDNTWLMALQIPTQGEMVFSFPGLDQPQASITPSAEDFRWRIVHALRETSNRRRLGYPTAGRDFIQGLHHVLRWVKPGQRAELQCRELRKFEWECERDKQKTFWTWNEGKQELLVSQSLRPNWMMQAIFKNLTGPIFKRVTLEIKRIGEEKSFVELRQEIFFTTP